MTLRKLRLQARYNVLTPAALIGVSSALLMSAPVFAAAQTNTGNVPSVLIGAGNAFTNTGTITTDGTHPAVYSTTDVESVFNATGASIVGNSHTGVYISGNVNGAVTNNGTVSSTSSYGIEVTGNAGSIANNGTVDSYYTGIYVGGNVGSFSNTNSITSDVDYGVYIGGNVTDTFTNTATGSITGDTYGVYISGTTNAFNNAGAITGGTGSGEYGAYLSGAVTSFQNSGHIDGYNGVYFGSTVGSFVNSATGQIHASGSSDAYGVHFAGAVTSFANAGTISSDYQAVKFNSGVGTFENSSSGTISSNDGYGVEISGSVNSFTNAGKIMADWTGVYISGTVDNFLNTGTISSNNDAGVEIYGPVNNFTNSSSGVISGTWAGVYIYNYGNPVNFSNAGTISGNEYGLELYADNATITNASSGVITGGTASGVYVSGSNNVLTNAGKISGSYYAVDFSGSNNTLKVLTGGTFGGHVWFNNSGTFDFSQYHGNMILEENGSLPTGNVLPGDNLYLQTATQVIVVGDSSVTNSSHPVSDVTNGINSLITNQLDFESGGGGDGAPLGFAPVRVNSAAEMATAKAMAPKVSDGQVFWASGIGGGSSNGVDASDVFGALVVGTHAQLQDGLRIGGLGAYAHSIATTDSSQTITADTGIIGAYGRADLDTVSLDFSILAGASTNASARTVAGPGGPETASATFGGWFINPTIGVSMPVLSSGKGDLSIVGSVGYLFGGFGGYTETGSSANLTVGAQTIGILDAAFGVKGKTDLGSNEHGVIVGKGTAELFAESNMGTSTVPISVLGTTIGNSLPPTALALGVRSSLSVEVPISDSVSFTGGGTVSLRTDGLISGAATAKISGTF